MFGPKQPGDYPDREIDCQEAISQGLADLIEQQVVTGATEAEATAALSGANVVGVRELIQDAVEAGWSEEEAATAIRVVSEGLHRGATGRDPDE
ncbi:MULTISPECIES: hypothetical protein [Brucella]|uniref:Uncharacterized protein n=1 Tax=Brucella tritici TaxID=94626 RepID=A0A6L3Y848_9HYPH|nr:MULTISPECIES: hypothetical protein [Brucella]KAB2674866.1 hypothetical protein F9L08_28185 [Brucella tritici]KAB2762302.1 hypothetical protein F9K98_10725 [Brucella anthropi]WGG58190.1 hypothetical protein QA414_07390 [Brucella intermedia]